MNKITLLKTDLTVSKFALGTGSYGTDVSESVAFAQMDLFLAGGGPKGRIYRICL